MNNTVSAAFNLHKATFDTVEDAIRWIKGMRKNSSEAEVISSYIVDGKLVLA